ncbi:MAG: hypothetical protein AABX54_04865 [Nanoarchaeota archaeon]
MATAIETTHSNFNNRKKEARELGCETLEDLINIIEKYESKGFSFEAKEDGRNYGDIWGTNTSLGGYLTFNEAEMILRSPVVGRIRHIEARDALDYIKAKNFFNEINMNDDYNLFKPA